MTESRPETRVPVNLKVRIWGMDAGGHTFFQHVSACNISSKGALLSGIEHGLTVGEIIGLQYGDKKARYKIVWVLEAGALQKIQAGIELVSEQECPWKAGCLPARDRSRCLPGIAEYGPGTKSLFL